MSDSFDPDRILELAEKYGIIKRIGKSEKGVKGLYLGNIRYNFTLDFTTFLKQKKDDIIVVYHRLSGRSVESLPKDEKERVFCMSLATVLRWWEVMGHERDNSEVVNTLAKFLVISLHKDKLAKLLGYTRWEAFWANLK